MKTMNNTCVEVLPALLDKTKVRTTRKAWTESNLKKSCLCVPDEICDCGKPKYFDFEKPAKYKVGDEVIVLWNGDMKEYHKLTKCKIIHELGYPIRLGKVEIISVEKIIIGKEISNFEDENVTYYYIEESETGEMKKQKEFAKKEGFKSPEEMFAYFEKHADLSTLKEFWTYKFKWI